MIQTLSTARPIRRRPLTVSEVQAVVTAPSDAEFSRRYRAALLRSVIAKRSDAEVASRVREARLRNA